MFGDPTTTNRSGGGNLFYFEIAEAVRSNIKRLIVMKEESYELGDWEMQMEMSSNKRSF